MEKKNIVFMFKNQKNDLTDYKMLKISMKQWFRLYDGEVENIYICGVYTEQDIKDIVNNLTENFLKKYKVKIINAKNIPKQFDTNKTNRANFQLISAWKHLQKPFIVATNDIFPIKKIDDSYLNMEYMIKYPDINKIPEDKYYWWLENYRRTYEYFKSKYNFENKIVYEGHNPYYITKEFMDFYLADPNLLFNMDRDTILTFWNKMNGREVLREKYIVTTFIRNKWQIKKKELQKAKMINATLPNHPKTKSLLSKILLK